MNPQALNYNFLAPRQIVFGWGRRAELGRLATGLGRRAFVVHGSQALESSGRLNELLAGIKNAGVDVVDLARSRGEPTVEQVDEAVDRARALGPRGGDLVVGIGGGSALDLAKAVAGLAAQPAKASVREYLEGVGSGRQLERAALPMIAVPTTAGTGSEATKNAVISVLDPPCKKSLRSDSMVPAVALLDPELTVSLPTEITAQSGLDAITQLIESYLSRRAQPIPQALALQGLSLAVDALPVACHDPADRAARERMAHAALLSGMALANSGLGLAHGVAASLGALCDVPHGLACAVMLPAALRFNLPTCERQMAELARGCGIANEQGTPAAAAGALIDRIESLGRQLGIPGRLMELGVRREQLPALVAGSHGNSLSGNPRDISDEQLHELLEAML